VKRLETSRINRQAASKIQSMKKEGHKKSNKIAEWPIIKLAEQNKTSTPTQALLLFNVLRSKTMIFFY